jgi:hypothetical protein
LGECQQDGRPVIAKMAEENLVVSVSFDYFLKIRKYKFITREKEVATNEMQRICREERV